MSGFIANARMYAVAPEVEAAWRELIERVAAEAEGPARLHALPGAEAIEELWARRDLGAVQMCGYPIALRLSDVTPLAAPVPAAEWAGGGAVYRSDLIVKADSAHRTLADTSVAARWTIAHSPFRLQRLSASSPDIPHPRATDALSRGRRNLVTARRILDAVLAGDMNVGPLDAFWQMLIRKYHPELDGRRAGDEIDGCGADAGFRRLGGDRSRRRHAVEAGLRRGQGRALVSAFGAGPSRSRASFRSTRPTSRRPSPGIGKRAPPITVPRSMRIAVLGAGAVGGVVAWHLAQAGAGPIVIARPESAERLAREGLTLVSASGPATVPVQATSDPRALGPRDLVLVALKAHDGPAALPASPSAAAARRDDDRGADAERHSVVVFPRGAESATDGGAPHHGRGPGRRPVRRRARRPHSRLRRLYGRLA